MAEMAEPLSTELTGSWWLDSWLGRAWTRFTAWPVVYRFLLVLMIVYVAKQAIYVVVFPPFTGHDEIAHYGYLQTVATEHRVPILLKDKLPSELYHSGYCQFALDWGNSSWCSSTDPQYINNPPPGGNFPVQTPKGFTYQYHPIGYNYVANHPPLYYILMTPIYWLTERGSPVTQLYALRVAAIPFGILTVLLAFLMVRALFPGDAFLAITVPTFVAFQTQISYEAAMVNNDIVCIAAYSWVLYLLIVGIRDRFPPRICVLTGFAFGIGLLAKGTSISAGLLIALAIIAALGWRHIRLWLARGMLTAIPAAVLAAPWYIFLYHTYGNLTAYKQILEIQWWNKPAGTFFGMLTSLSFMRDRFQETWGDFGWRRIPLDSTILWVIGIPLLLCVAGFILYCFTARNLVADTVAVATGEGVPPETGRLRAKSHREADGAAAVDAVQEPERWQWIGVGLLVVTCIVAYLAIIQFGTTFSLTQARYYFPAVNAVAVLLMLGLRTLIPRRYHPYGQLGVFAALFLLNVMIFTQYVLPYYPHW